MQTQNKKPAEAGLLEFRGGITLTPTLSRKRERAQADSEIHAAHATHAATTVAAAGGFIFLRG